MKMTKTLTLGALSVMALASACTMETAVEEGQLEELGTSQEEAAGACANHQAVHSFMAALAVSVARDLGRLRPHANTFQGDFKWDGSADGGTGAMVLTAQGEARCNEWPSTSNPSRCVWLKELLKLQNWTNGGHGMVLGGAILDVGVLKSRLAASFNRQQTCIDRPDNGMSDNCPAELHDLKNPTMNGSGCAKNTWFDAKKAGTNDNLQYPAQVGNMLLWAGWGIGENNPWVGFQVSGAKVKIDPLPGTSDGNPPATSGGNLLVSYHYQANPKYGCITDESINYSGATCKADQAYCTYPTGGTCPATVRRMALKPGTAFTYCCTANL